MLTKGFKDEKNLSRRKAERRRRDQRLAQPEASACEAGLGDREYKDRAPAGRHKD
jgi:hypothetical protein